MLILNQLLALAFAILMLYLMITYLWPVMVAGFAIVLVVSVVRVLLK